MTVDRATALQAFLASRRDMRFAWEKNDCCMFAADWIRALTGRDPAEGFRGRYRTEIGAWRVLRSEGIGSLAELADRFLERLPDDQRARRGDVILMRGPVNKGRRHDYFTICLGPDAVGPSRDRGLQRCPLDLRLIAWRVD